MCLLALLWYLIVPRTSIFYRKYIYRPHFGQLNKIDLVLTKGESYRLYVLGINKRVSFTSTDIKVAYITVFGRVHAVRPGTTIVKTKVNNKVLKCRVRVIDINKQTVTLKVGESDTLSIKGMKGKVAWSSKDKSIATINKKGKVIGISKGSTVVYGKIQGKTVSCKITVK